MSMSGSVRYPFVAARSVPVQSRIWLCLQARPNDESIGDKHGRFRLQIDPDLLDAGREPDTTVMASQVIEFRLHQRRKAGLRSKALRKRANDGHQLASSAQGRRRSQNAYYSCFSFKPLD
jgi:hypothetical protein